MDQERQLHEVAGFRGELEKLKAESTGKIDLLQKEKSSLKEKNKFCRRRTKNWQRTIKVTPLC
jgi:hypothetical protein